VGDVITGVGLDYFSPCQWALGPSTKSQFLVLFFIWN